MRLYTTCHNQDTCNGAREWAFWGIRDNGSMRHLGIAYKTNYGRWLYQGDDLQGRAMHIDKPTLREIREAVKDILP